MVKCLIYCTKSKDNKLIRYYGDKHTLITKKHTIMPNPDFYLNGKIVAQFDCENIIEFDINGKHLGYAINLKPIIEKSCLSLEEMKKYIGDKKGYAIHISNLKIFDSPKELSNYCIDLKNGFLKSLEKAPQNMMNVREWKAISEFYYKTDDYVLISIKPEWVEKILNGEKTIEVRKSIVNKLKELI